MIDSTNPRIMADNIRELESQISANDVEGNPSGTGYNTLLTKIKIDMKKYKLPNQVIDNPAGEATGALSKVSIDGTVYSISDATYDTSVTGIEVKKAFGITVLSLIGADLEFKEDGRTLTSTVPEGFRPSRNTLGHAEIYTGSVYTPCLISVFTSGEITVANFGGTAIASAQLEYLKSPNIVY